MNTEEKIKPILDNIYEIIKDTFSEEHKTSKEECLGVAISKYLKWDVYDIAKVACFAFQDANFPELADRLNKIMESEQ